MHSTEHAVWIHSAIVRRLTAMQYPVVPLTRSDLNTRYARGATLPEEIHYEVELAGQSCALSVWFLPEDMKDRSRLDLLNNELAQVVAGDRMTAAHMAVVDINHHRFTIYSELVSLGSVSGAFAEATNQAMDRFLSALWTGGPLHQPVQA